MTTLYQQRRRAWYLGLFWLLTIGQLVAQSSTTISGRVTDETGQALPGVTIVVKGTSNGTTTSAEGTYRLSIPSGNATLIASYVGYLNQEIPVANRSTIDVRLVPDDKTLNEVVVVGYGTQNRKDLTGSIASIGAEEIAKLPVASVDQALQGKVPGVQISTTSGEPGGSPNILIRGVSSITGGAQPLIVIDGFPVSNADGTNPLNAIDPRDIESVDVLKDASATAIYGSRGSNGVIIITTKRGKAGKPRVTLEAYYGVQQLAKKVEMMNAQEFAQWTIDGRNAGYLDNVATGKLTDNNTVRPGTNYDIPVALSNPAALGEGTDWQSLLFRTAPISNYKATISGGNDALKYSVSGGFFEQQGIVINTYLKRYNLKANLDARVSDRVKIGFSLLPTYSTQKRLNTADHYAAYGVIQAAMAISPTIAPYDSLGNYSYQDGDAQIDVKNPLRVANEYQNYINSFRMLGNSYLDYEITRDLRFRTTIGGDIFYNENRLWVPASLAGGSNYTSPASASAFNQLNSSWLNENTLTYRRAFTEKHQFDAVAGVTFQKFYSNRLTANAVGFPDDLVSNINGGTVNGGSELITRETLMSFLARVNYTLNRKYLFTATIRRDGSSKFGPNNRWGNFPSGSVAWRVSEEPFMRVIPAINDLKFRAGYGLTGNNNIGGINGGNYRYQAQLAPTNYIIGDANVPGLSPNSFENASLAWESMSQYDIGIDLALFKNRISLTADYYNRVNRDMLFDIQTPSATGLTLATVNLGSVLNRGWEFALATQNVQTKDFGWTTNFNISFNKNEVLSMSSNADKVFGNTGGRGNTNVTQVGSSIGSFYGRQATGVFQTDEEAKAYGKQPFARAGDIRWADINNDGAVNDDDRTLLGSPLPKYTAGFNNTFRYKAFSLDIFTNAVVGNNIYNALFAFNNSSVQNNAKYVDDRRWRNAEQPGDGNWGRAIRGGRNNNTLFSSLNIFDGSYWRIRNVVLNYTVPGTFAQRIGMQSVRLNASATNLLTVSDYPGFDPEVGNAGNNQRAPGVDFGTYPVAHTITFGLTAQF